MDDGTDPRAIPPLTVVRPGEGRVADLAAAGATEIAEFLAIADAYGLQLHEPEWQADVIRRYGLTPPSW